MESFSAAWYLVRSLGGFFIEVIYFREVTLGNFGV